MTINFTPDEWRALRRDIRFRTTVQAVELLARKLVGAPLDPETLKAISGDPVYRDLNGLVRDLPEKFWPDFESPREVVDWATKITRL